MRVSFDEVNDQIRTKIPVILSEFQPTLLIAVGCGGFVPASIARNTIRTHTGTTLPTFAIILSSYSNHKQKDSGINVSQWLPSDADLSGHNVLIIDEIDDSRQTLAYITNRIHSGANGVPNRLGVFVVHNRITTKKGVFPESLSHYSCQEVHSDEWVEYPWKG
eukprot:c16206_g1_i1.p1 GENE.c16206_g1_i1~~c16206_g1_i1.p1  ORF type:complete len:176 (+),score=21.85 c16206_g1_i1:42-530(+)